MLFEEVVKSVGTFTDLKRIAKAYVIDYKNLSFEELQEALIKTAPQYYNEKNVQNSLRELLLHPFRNPRILHLLFIKEVLLNKDDFMSSQKQTEDDILQIEQNIVNEANEKILAENKEQTAGLELFQFVLETAWENNDDISRDEKNLIEKIKNRMNITDYEYRIIESRIGKFPTANNILHTRDEINETRRILQEYGLLLTVRDSDLIDYDVIPQELALVLRGLFGIEMRKHSYLELLNCKYIRSRKYLQNVLSKGNVFYTDAMTIAEYQNLCMERIRPSIVLGGYSPRDGLNLDQLKKWCQELELSVSGQKNNLIDRIIGYYDTIKEKSNEAVDDERKIWFEYYEDLAFRRLPNLRKQGIIDKDLDCEHKFEGATDYLFERYLGHKPLLLTGTEHPDGVISFNNKLLFWDNKSKETPVNLADHIKQFDRYIQNAEKPVACFLVIGPDFTPDSEKECIKYGLAHDTIITLITAAELRQLALSWNKDESFPLGYFRQGGRFNLSMVEA